MQQEISSITSPLLLAAFILDLLLGESKLIPHPVVLMGGIISRWERLLNKETFSSATKKAGGITLALFFPVLVFLLTASLIKLFYSLNNLAGHLLTVYLAYTTLSLKGLKEAAFKVMTALLEHNMPAARATLSHIVGRRTENLDEAEIVRGTVESVAENTSDGVIAPLFYLIIGGVPLSMAYKAINTLDSMIGYKNEKYADFGRASARLDDLVNLIPARLTALLLVTSAFLLRMDWKSAWRVMVKDAGNHPSPNAGYPEAAAAGAINIRLGGTNNYSGRIETRPYIGDGTKKLEREDIRKVVKLMYLSVLLMISGSIVLKGLLP